MPVRRRAFTCCAALLASALNSGTAAAADAKPAAADAAARLQKVEAALRDAGLLPASPEARDAELKPLQERLEKLQGQRRNLEDAVRHGLDAESVKPVFATLEKEIAELQQRIANVAGSSGPSEPAAPSRLPERLTALETAVSGLQTTQPGTPAAATTSVPPSSNASAGSSPAPAVSAASKPKEAKPSGRAGWKDGFFIESADGAYSLKPSGFLDFKFAYAGLADKDDEFALSVPYARLAFKGTLFTMDLVNSATQRNASASEELAATAEELSGQAMQLQSLIGFFSSSGERRGASVHAIRGARRPNAHVSKALGA